MDWCCYLIISLDSNKTYIGSTNNFQKRLDAHNNAGKYGAKYTRGDTWIPVLIITGFIGKCTCLSFENVWKKMSKKRRCVESIWLSMITELTIGYSKDSKNNRIIDLILLLNDTMMEGGKYRKNGSDYPNELSIKVFSEEWINELPWPYYVSSSLIFN